MRKLYIIFLFILFTCSSLSAQIGINSDGSSADPSAIFDIKSTSKGVLLPRMTYEERNAINNPSEGLMVFCTDCGMNGAGILCLYTGNEWYAFSLCQISAPVASANLTPPSAIVWQWNKVDGAIGYKWSTTNNFSNAIDMFADTSKTESGISCDTIYTRYVWAYNGCGLSVPSVLTQSTIMSCWSCGDNMTINHLAGEVAPVAKTTVYETVTNVPGEASKCWITKNLGANQQAFSTADVTEASAGWYWQFNRRQGFKHDGTTRTPTSTWVYSIMDYSSWTLDNDPCTLELGAGWRIPTKLEWVNVDAECGWGTNLGPWSSLLKMHMAGYLYPSSGILTNRGLSGYYWSSTQSADETAWILKFSTGTCTLSAISKPFGSSIRCVKD